MAFSSETQEIINAYIDGHLNNWDWHKEQFNFIEDETLRDRLADEFLSTRYIYKLLEGIEADSLLLRAQIRLQVLSYASIYEAVIHHVLFEELSEKPEVRSLTQSKRFKRISIPLSQQEVLNSALKHDGKKIIPTYEDQITIDITKIRFDKKANCAEQLGLIEEWLKKDIIEFYEARNAIHIHAEIKKNLQYQLELSKKAYWRMEPFIDQIKKICHDY